MTINPASKIKKSKLKNEAVLNLESIVSIIDLGLARHKISAFAPGGCNSVYKISLKTALQRNLAPLIGPEKAFRNLSILYHRKHSYNTLPPLESVTAEARKTIIRISFILMCAASRPSMSRCLKLVDSRFYTYQITFCLSVRHETIFEMVVLSDVSSKGYSKKGTI